MSWLANFRDISRPDVPLCEHTWYKLGGPARWLVTPRSVDELASFLRACREAGERWRVLGHGANVLVRDEGCRDIVICLSEPAFTSICLDGQRVVAGGGADFPKLIRTALAGGLLGLEALAGIPGTAGGLTRMNAGGKYGEIRQFIESVRFVTERGELEERGNAECGFAYRRSALSDGIVVSVTLLLERGDAAAGLARHRTIWNEKAAAQPAVSQRSAGCVFKNPPGASAGKLLNEAGLKGVRVGGAEISTRHANFIVAGPTATATDVLELIKTARERVRERFGVELEQEIEVW